MVFHWITRIKLIVFLCIYLFTLALHYTVLQNSYISQCKTCIIIPKFLKENKDSLALSDPDHRERNSSKYSTSVTLKLCVWGLFCISLPSFPLYWINKASGWLHYESGWNATVEVFWGFFFSVWSFIKSQSRFFILLCVNIRKQSSNVAHLIFSWCIVHLLHWTNADYIMKL